MRIDFLSVFPDMFDAVMGTSIMKRAQDKGIIEYASHNLRDWTHDVHRTTDDAPYGGGPGLLMKPEPIYEAMDELLLAGNNSALGVCETRTAETGDVETGAAETDTAGLAMDELLASNNSTTVIIPTPAGEPFTQRMAEELSTKEHLIFICGHYEGLDERVYELADLRVSLGDYVLTGGELAAMVMTDAICRLIPGVLGDEMSSVSESFSSEGLLEYPQYTRPSSYRGMDVPEILLSGDHGRVDKWRRQKAIETTARFRPDMLEKAQLTKEERLWLSKRSFDPQ